MNSILTKQAANLSKSASKKSKNNVETTGSLAMNSTPLFVVPVYNYDMFVPTNPFSLNIDFSSYSAEGQENLAANTGFMQGFANAMSVMSETSGMGGYSASAGVSAGVSAGSCSMSGGFVSVG